VQGETVLDACRMPAGFVHSAAPTVGALRQAEDFGGQIFGDGKREEMRALTELVSNSTKWL
jgi:hypothetical protein